MAQPRETPQPAKCSDSTKPVHLHASILQLYQPPHKTLIAKAMHVNEPRPGPRSPRSSNSFRREARLFTKDELSKTTGYVCFSFYAFA